MGAKQSCRFAQRVSRHTLPKVSYIRQLRVHPELGNFYIEHYSYLIIQKGTRTEYVCPRAVAHIDVRSRANVRCVGTVGKHFYFAAF